MFQKTAGSFGDDCMLLGFGNNGKQTPQPLPSPSPPSLLLLAPPPSDHVPSGVGNQIVAYKFSC